MKIEFNKTGYDPFIDFIKAFAILAVLAGHTSLHLRESGYALWYGMQVPLFVLVQTFHVLKKEDYRLDFKKLFLRIFLPFLAVQAVLICYGLLTSEDTGAFLRYTIRGGGLGMGSYFPWIYLQLALVLAAVAKVRARFGPCAGRGPRIAIALGALVVSEGLEILCSVAGISENLYRLLAVRYVFLIYLGWVWVDKGIVLNVKTVLLSLLSLGTIVFFYYFYRPMEPWLFDSPGWSFHRWPCYFYVSTLMCGLLYFLYRLLSRSRICERAVRMLARCSYDIFLMQMLVIRLLPRRTSFAFISDASLRAWVRILVIWILSLLGGYLLNKLYTRKLR